VGLHITEAFFHMSTKAAPAKHHRTGTFGKSISVAIAAERAGISDKSIHRHRAHFMWRRIGRRVVISEASFDAWIERNTYGVR
jgi:hypothetical protein